MLQNEYFLTKIGADTAENEQHFAEILPKIGNSPTGSPDSPPRGRGLQLGPAAGELPAALRALQRRPPLRGEVHRRSDNKGSA